MWYELTPGLRDVTDARRAERNLRRLADEQAVLRRVATLHTFTEGVTANRAGARRRPLLESALVDL